MYLVIGILPVGHLVGVAHVLHQLLPSQHSWWNTFNYTKNQNIIMHVKEKLTFSL